MLRKWSVLVLLLLAMPMVALAQNTGKLSGVITDADTGETLPGASVLLVGTQLGTVTSIDGDYFVIGIPVGTYDIQYSFVGYQPQTLQGVEISSGYTTELNIALTPGVELGEIVVEYERPLIQKDAVGAPKIVTGEDIVNLPVRGAASVASIQAGVVSREGSGTLNVRGGRGSEVTYFIDGVKVIGTTAVPQSAIQEQEMIIGNISARYGDAMSGIINITTKSGSRRFFGSFEGITSEALDDYGYNLFSGTIGGPVVGENVNFFLSAEYLTQADSNPRAIGELYVSDDLLSTLRSAPQALTATNADGNEVLISLPGSMAAGATLPVDDNGQLIIQDGTITASDGTVLNIPEGVEAANISLAPQEAAAFLSDDNFEVRQDKRQRGNDRLSLAGNFTMRPIDQVSLRIGGRYNVQEFDNISTRSVIFAPETGTTSERDDYQIYATWTHYLSNSTFYQLQADFSQREGVNYDPRFGSDIESIFNYADIDDPTNSLLASYKTVTLVPETRIDQHGTPDDPSDDTEFTVNVPTYVQRYGDGPSISSQTTAGLVTPVGGFVNRFSQFKNQQIRFSATATTQIGLHQIEFGGEFERRTQRSWGMNPRVLSRWKNDGSAEAIAAGETNFNPDGYTNYGDIPFEPFEGLFYYGYNYNGTSEVDSEDLTSYVDDCGDNGDFSCYDVAPYEPIYYGGYIQDKIEFRDIVLNIGMRVDVFDNNTRVLFDDFSRLDITRAGDIGGAPSNIGNDFAVYFSGNDVVGYRDLDGNFFDSNGQEAQAGDILLLGKPEAQTTEVTEDTFRDYEPQVTFMPRIGVSFPVTDQALFFARYGVTSQRPSGNNFEPLSQLVFPTGRINGNNLQPERTTEYELGFRQRVGDRAALQISGFFRQIEDLIQLSDLRQSFPQGYSTYANFDFGTIKGMELGFDLRRTNGVALNANYTLSFASGTGSSSTTTSTIVWIDETPPNFISPLSFDQRHRVNLSLDYRLGEGEGPTVGGAKVFQNLGVNVLATAGSGFPYTGITEAFNITTSKAPNPTGGINEQRMPWQTRLDLRVDRKFPLGNRASLSAFLWMQNILDQDNINFVWRATGLADTDGFLSTVEGQQFLDSNDPAAQTLYNHRNRSLGNYGIPRVTRIGVRLDF